MSNLYSSYERLAKIYAKNAGINLIIRGGGFCTDGKKIVIAEIPDELNRTLKDPALAGLVHECNHIKHSWFPRNEKEAKEKKLDKFQKTYKGLINNIEDVRILHLGRKEYPGMDSLQKSGLTFIKNSFLKDKIEEKAIPISALLGMCIQWKESNENTSFFPPTINKMADMTKDIWHGIEWNSYEKGHDEAENAVKRIIKRLKQEHQPTVSEEEPKKNDEQEKTEGNGDKRERNKNKKDNVKKDEKENNDEKNSKEDSEEEIEKHEGEGDINNENEEEETKSEESSEEETGTSANEMEQTSEDQTPPQQEEEIGETDYDGEDLEKDLEKLFEEDEKRDSPQENTGLMEVMTEIIESIIQKHNTSREKHIPHPEIVLHDVEEHIKNPFKDKHICKYDLDQYKDQIKSSLEKIDKETEKLKARALPLLMAEKRDSFIYEQKEGIIDGAQLYKIQKGNGNIYKQKILGKKVNTAVTILCDVSGSMTGTKMSMLRSTLLVIGDTMFALKIPFEILSYTTSSTRNAQVKKIIEGYYNNPQNYPYNRIEPLLLTIIKNFNENYVNIRNLIPLMRSNRNTPTNEAFKWGCKRLIQRKENRKLLFILEDGHPGLESSDRSLLQRDLIENVAQAEKNLIEIIGIGLLSNEVEKFYKNYIVINDVNQISIKVYQALLKALSTHHQNRR